MTVSKILCLTFLFVWVPSLSTAQSQVIRLWSNDTPGAIENPTYVESYTYDALGEVRGISKVSEPTLTPFIADSKTNGTAVIIFPGGGYSHLAIDKEGYKVAKWLNTLGISAFVLKYRMPSNKTMEDRSIGPLQDAQEAIRIVRRNAVKWNLDSDKIGVLGFSAGGHLASTLSTQYGAKVYASEDETTARPDFSILVYPVISMEDGITHQGSKNNLLGEVASQEMVGRYSNARQVNAETPPTFLVHATDDKADPVENSLEYFQALKKYDVPAEMHIYESGGHGFGMGVSGTNGNWPQNLKKWFSVNEYLKSE